MPRGDDGFEDFVREWSPTLLRVSFLLTGDRHEAEDLLQTALLKTARRWSALDHREAAYPYVRRILVTTHTSWRRRRRVPHVLTDEVPEPSVPSAGPELGRTLVVLDTLPAQVRATVVLRCYGGLTEAETADVLGCSVGSVKSQTSRGLARLRAALSTDDHVREGAR